MTWEIVGLVGNIIIFVSILVHWWVAWKVRTYHKLTLQRIDAIEAMVDEETDKLVTAMMESLQEEESGEAKRFRGGVLFRKTPTKH